MAKKSRSNTSRDEQLVDQLLIESHGLRMKYEDFSRYTEGQVEEFVLTKRRLNHELSTIGEQTKWLSQRATQLEAAVEHLEQQRDHLLGERDRTKGVFAATVEHLEQQRDHALLEGGRLETELSHARGDVELLHNQRAMVQGELVKITHECLALQNQLVKAVKQRDRARERVVALEASRAVRFAARLRKLLRR